jgi:hypothetical protein
VHIRDERFERAGRKAHGDHERDHAPEARPPSNASEYHVKAVPGAARASSSLAIRELVLHACGASTTADSVADRGTP